MISSPTSYSHIMYGGCPISQCFFQNVPKTRNLCVTVGEGGLGGEIQGLKPGFHISRCVLWLKHILVPTTRLSEGKKSGNKIWESGFIALTHL